VSRKTDIKFGRRGGRFLPDDYVSVDFANAKRCDVCGGPMVVGQRGRHYVCDPESMVGRRCVCAPGCTGELVGDGPTPCDAACEPCRLMRNRLHSEVDEWRRFR
jgi:hypothetical protein